ncbi:[histone H3]-lysine(4) N-trimethyltransferase [Ranunculus cassubicifolius]
MDPPECPLRCGNSKSKPSISFSHGVRKCTEKKYEYRHYTSGDKKHKIQVNVPRAKVQRAIRLFRATFRALFQDNGGDFAGLNGTKIKRFDLMSATILKKNNEWVNSGRQIVGTVPGVEVGDEYHYRVELVLIGLHRQYESGIDYLNEDGRTLATSIVASGVYADDMHDSDVLVYCGHGGNPQRKKSGGDQKLKRGNLALKNSMNAKSPVRVIRGFKEAKGNETLLARLDMDGKLVYDGLYMVEHYWEEQGQHGNNVFKFRLRRIPGQPVINWLQKTERANQQ